MKYYVSRGKSGKIPVLLNSEISSVTVDGRAVVHVRGGGKFIVTKCGNIEWLCREISATIGRVKSGTVNGNGFYDKFCKYVVKNNIGVLIIDIKMESTNGYSVLKYELSELIKHFGTNQCLNINNIPYIPKPKTAIKGSNWLTQNEGLNFRKLLLNYEY